MTTEHQQLVLAAHAHTGIRVHPGNTAFALDIRFPNGAAVAAATLWSSQALPVTGAGISYPTTVPTATRGFRPAYMDIYVINSISYLPRYTEEICRL